MPRLLFRRARKMRSGNETEKKKDPTKYLKAIPAKKVTHTCTPSHVAKDERWMSLTRSATISPLLSWTFPTGDSTTASSNAQTKATTWEVWVKGSSNLTAMLLLYYLCRLWLQTWDRWGSKFISSTPPRVPPHRPHLVICLFMSSCYFHLFTLIMKYYRYICP